MPKKMFNVTLRISQMDLSLEAIPVEEIRMLQVRMLSNSTRARAYH